MNAIPSITSVLTAADLRDHFLARWGVRRSGHRVRPGLYALGAPGPDSPVFVTANYTLSFDALRAALSGIDGYVLVLDTKGINVWCAAGKGTFGTDELVNRIESTGLAGVVSHRKLILPQLGATGVAAHEVRKLTGFSVTYGPVRAADIPEFLRTGTATPEMRRVRFPMHDRAVLIPVEFVHVLWPAAVSALVLYFLAGPLAAWGAVAAVLAGAVLFPLLLPWLPTVNFSTKGFLLGVVVALPFAAAAYLGHAGAPEAHRIVWALAYVLGMTQVTAFLGLNFTGSSTYTSRTGVKREIEAYFPAMAWLFGAGVVLMLVMSGIRLFGGAGA